jgi:hypothetical protein
VPQRFAVSAITVACITGAAGLSWAQSPFQSAPVLSPLPVVRPARPQPQQTPPTATAAQPSTPAPAGPVAVVAPVAPPAPTPPPSLAGRWVGVITCPGYGDAAMMIAVAASASDQYAMTATWSMGMIGVDEDLSGSITSGKQIGLDQQFMLDHRASLEG